MAKLSNIDHEKHNDILCKWQDGWSATRIARRVGLSRNLVSLVVCKARERGDSRAIMHTGKDGAKIGRDWSRQVARSSEYLRHLEAVI